MAKKTARSKKKAGRAKGKAAKRTAKRKAAPKKKAAAKKAAPKKAAAKKGDVASEEMGSILPLAPIADGQEMIATLGLEEHHIACA